MASKFLAVALIGLASALTPGSSPEVHPKLKTYRCTKAGGCKSVTNAIVLDALSHPVHQLNDTSKNCGDWGNPPPASVCPDKATCAKNCIIEGVSDYAARGISTNGSAMTLKQLSSSGSVLSPRVYLLAEDEKKYEMMRVNGLEFSFDVDVSTLPCGMNSALYFSEMEEDGGKSTLNPTGASYGNGYCDAQCFTTPFINGEGNIGGYGACCNELDIWEANKAATQLAPHTCNQTGVYLCSGDECKFDGVCDKNGCGQNTYRMGNTKFYGANLTVDTNRPFTVVTQFHQNAQKTMTEIHRLYVQDGKTFELPNASASGVPAMNFINDTWCEANGATRYMDLGATAEMGSSLDRGMVLAFSIWWSDGDNMNWLDADGAGPCSTTEGSPTNIVKVSPQPQVVFSNLKWGEIGSTYGTSGGKDHHHHGRFRS